MKKIIAIPLAFFIFINHSVFADELYPLEVGRYWRYEVEGDGPKSVTNSITRNKTVRGTTWYLLNEWGENFWVRNAPAGQIEAVNLSLDDPPTRKVDELLVYKYPYTVAEPYSLYDDQVVVEEEREVTVPAGRFKCAVYYFDLGGGYYSRSCIAPGVGVIVNESKLKDLHSVSSLVEYGVADGAGLASEKGDAVIKELDDRAAETAGGEQAFYEIMGAFSQQSQAAAIRWNESFATVQAPRILDFSRLDSDAEYAYQTGVLEKHIAETESYREYFHAMLPTIENRLAGVEVDDGLARGAIRGATESYEQKRKIVGPLLDAHVAYCENMIGILDLLQQNADGWAWEKDTLVMEDDALINSFNEMMEALQKDETTINRLARNLN